MKYYLYLMAVVILAVNCIELKAVNMFQTVDSTAIKQREEGVDTTSIIMPDSTQWGNSAEWETFGDTLSLGFHTPSIELLYGMAQPEIYIKNSNQKFKQSGLGEIRLGYSSRTSNILTPGIIDYSYNYIHIGRIATSWSSNIPKDSALSTDAWRFGFGSSGGYGYKFSSNADLTLYHTGSWNWTSINFQNNAGDSLAQLRINRFNDAFRFGTSFDGGILLRVSSFGLNIAYERTAVFPRHQFWYWVASEMTEGIGQAAISHFAGDIVNSSPIAGPVVYFILKNGLSYGFYELRKKSMNWPVFTEVPFMYQTFKIGLNFSF